MIPFTVSHLNFQYKEKLEELRLAYSQRRRAIGDGYAVWTNTGWQHGQSTDTPLQDGSVITAEFFSTMQHFCRGPGFDFAPDCSDWWAQAPADFEHASSRTFVVRSYRSLYDEDGDAWIAGAIGGNMVDGESAGFRWATETEIVDGEMRPIINVGGQNQYFSEDHILGQWVFEDLVSFFSILTAYPAQCGVYNRGGTTEREFHERHEGYGIRTTGDDPDIPSGENLWLGRCKEDRHKVLSDLWDDILAEIPSRTDEYMGAITKDVGQRTVALVNYVASKSVHSGINVVFSLPPGTETWQWSAFVALYMDAVGGYECAWSDYVVFASELVSTVDFYWLEYQYETINFVLDEYIPDYTRGKSTGNAVSTDDGKLHTDSVYGTTEFLDSTAGFEGSDWMDVSYPSAKYDEPQAAIGDIDPDYYDSIHALWEGFYPGTAGIGGVGYAYLNSVYGAFGAWPGWGVAKFVDQSTLRKYDSALVRFSFTNGNTPGVWPCSIANPEIINSANEGMNYGISNFFIEFEVSDPDPLCPSDAITCTGCDSDSCVVCDGSETCQTCNTCEGSDTCQSCDSCEGCDWCDICDSCDSCNACDTCETCDEEDTCETCDSCDVCNSCDACETCETAMDGTPGCVYCNAANVCLFCDSCDACESCDFCETCDFCDACDTCDTCNACEGCDGCETCETCETCNSCDHCDTCDTCQGCEVCDGCDTCNGDSCAVCDGGDVTI